MIPTLARCTAMRKTILIPVSFVAMDEVTISQRVPSLTSLMVSVDVKHHAYLLTIKTEVHGPQLSKRTETQPKGNRTVVLLLISRANNALPLGLAGSRRPDDTAAVRQAITLNP